MSAIDVQNAKQIRDPMDVLITMEVPDEEITLTYSGYSSAKVADGVLNQQSWPMRQLADLKGDGFPLDGSRVLYNSSTSASATNGKIGVRSNVGEAVSITVTGNQTIASLSLFVAGAESVTYNGTTSAIVGGQAIIPVGARSITLTFNPASTTGRIEVSDIIAGTSLRITNDSIIRCVVSLRSDLSLFDQTLPESELNVEVYNDADISEVVASLPEDTPITYQAGYPGDMSPLRKFYVSGQVTWEDNVLNIHAVDAVHFLSDVNFVAPLTEMNSGNFQSIVVHALDRGGIEYTSRLVDTWGSDSYRWIIRENTNAREFIAFMNQCFNLTGNRSTQLVDGSYDMMDFMAFSYVDAGIPTVRNYRGNTGRIAESDCADIKKEISPVIGVVTADWEAITNNPDEEEEGAIAKVGTATITKDVGTTLSFDQYTRFWQIGLFAGRSYDNDIATKMMNKYGTFWGYGYMLRTVPADSYGAELGGYLPRVKMGDATIAYKAAYGEIPQEEFKTYPTPDPVTTYSTFVPWSQSYDGWRYDDVSTHLIDTATQMWNVLKNANIVDANAASLDLDIYGWAYYRNKSVVTYAKDSNADKYQYSDLPVLGRIAAKTSRGSYIEIFPSKMLAAPMYRSPVTYSFTWKGDPRLQPRDQMIWERLDGTEEDITLETITITHENGGTVAEITARKGIV